MSVNLTCWQSFMNCICCGLCCHTPTYKENHTKPLLPESHDGSTVQADSRVDGRGDTNITPLHLPTGQDMLSQGPTTLQHMTVQQHLSVNTDGITPGLDPSIISDTSSSHTSFQEVDLEGKDLSPTQRHSSEEMDPKTPPQSPRTAMQTPISSPTNTAGQRLTPFSSPGGSLSSGRSSPDHTGWQDDLVEHSSPKKI